MKIVIDANVVISLLIKPGKPKLLLREFDIYAPEFLFAELEKHQEGIVAKTKLSQTEFEEFLKVLSRIIKTVPRSRFLKHLQQADVISPDPNDVHYFALALHLSSPIWSNDKELKEQKDIRVYSTKDLLEIKDSWSKAK